MNTTTHSHYPNSLGITGARNKRRELVAQCERLGIRAHFYGRGKNGGRSKPTTIGRMRRLIKAAGKTPIC